MFQSSMSLKTTPPRYRGTSLTRKHSPLGPYRRPMPRVLGGWAFSYGRGTPVLSPRSLFAAASHGFTEQSQVDVLRLWCSCVNFGAV